MLNLDRCRQSCCQTNISTKTIKVRKRQGVESCYHRCRRRHRSLRCCRWFCDWNDDPAAWHYRGSSSASHDAADAASERTEAITYHGALLHRTCCDTGSSYRRHFQGGALPAVPRWVEFSVMDDVDQHDPSLQPQFHRYSCHQGKIL